jgi:hypothetical protein
MYRYHRKAAHALQTALTHAKHAPKASLLSHIIWGRDLQAERSDALEKARKYMPRTTTATTAAADSTTATAAAASGSSSSSKASNSQQRQQQQPTAALAQVQGSTVHDVQQSEVPQWLRSSYNDDAAAASGSSSTTSATASKGVKRGRDSNVQAQAVEERAKQCLAKARPHFPQ